MSCSYEELKLTHEELSIAHENLVLYHGSNTKLIINMIPICSVHIILKKIILQDVWEKFSGVNQDCWLKLNEKKAN